MPTDKGKKIVSQVETALKKEMQLSSLDIHVDAKDEVVMLTGVVDTLAEKAFAQKAAGQIPGVSKVENYLTISTDGNLTDDEISAHVEQHLRNVPGAERLSKVGAKVEGGSVVLMGRAENLSDKTNAVKAAQKAAGAKDIVNNIQLDPPGNVPPADDQITSHVNQRFSTSGLSLPDIDIATKDGAVFLNGYVEEQHMMELAEELAMEVQGVRSVKNYLKIRGRWE